LPINQDKRDGITIVTQRFRESLQHHGSKSRIPETVSGLTQQNELNID